MNQQPPSTGSESESLRDWLLPPGFKPLNITGSALKRKRSTSMDDAGDANPVDVFKSGANGTKRRKARLNVWSRKAKGCTEAQRV